MEVFAFWVEKKKKKKSLYLYKTWWNIALKKCRYNIKLYLTCQSSEVASLTYIVGLATSSNIYQFFKQTPSLRKLIFPLLNFLCLYLSLKYTWTKWLGFNPIHVICEDGFGGGRPHNGKKCFRIFSSYHKQVQLCELLLPKCNFVHVVAISILP